jgi:hypothetical protein
MRNSSLYYISNDAIYDFKNGIIFSNDIITHKDDFNAKINQTAFEKVPNEWIVNYCEFTKFLEFVQNCSVHHYMLNG